MTEGYIKLHRKALDSMVFASEGLWKVWTWCLMKANYQDAWVPMTTGKGTTEVLVKRGQFIFGRKTASKELKQSETTIRDRMKKLESAQNIAMQSATHYSIVTVLNWETYQGDDLKPATQSANQPPTNRQPTATNKNDKKEKNIPAEAKKEEKPERKKDPIWDTIIELFGITPQTKGECSRIGKVVRDLKLKEATPERIEMVLSAFGTIFPGATPTPEAILKHWDMCKTYLINKKTHKPKPEGMIV